MKSNNNLLAYSIDFASFFIQKFMERDKIRNIILFGSVARDEFKENSDVDIFIDVVKDDVKMQKEANKILDDFFDSAKYKNYWRNLGIKNEIKLIIGDVNRWKELKQSITANGVLLYGKYKPEVKSGEHRVFFVWENVRPNLKRVLFNKKLFGYKQNNKFYEGLLQNIPGRNLGKGAFLSH